MSISSAKAISESVCRDRPASPRRNSRWKRRARVLFRLAIRKLTRLELVEIGPGGNPRVNPIRWIM